MKAAPVPLERSWIISEDGRLERIHINETREDGASIAIQRSFSLHGASGEGGAIFSLSHAGLDQDGSSIFFLQGHRRNFQSEPEVVTVIICLWG
jgi:hypothetical protein